MTDYRIRVGRPGDMLTIRDSGDDIEIRPEDSDGVRRLTVYEDSDAEDSGPEESTVVTAGPDHVLCYEVVGGA